MTLHENKDEAHLDSPQLGDLIEFQEQKASKLHTKNALLTRGRVMDFDPTDPSRCFIQTSSSQHLVAINLSEVFYKIIYEAGTLVTLSKEMVGITIDLSSDGDNFEVATIKRIDSNMNCALVVFSNGKKDWIDLSLYQVKVHCDHQFASENEMSPKHREAAHSPLKKKQSQVVDAFKSNSIDASSTAPTSALHRSQTSPLAKMKEAAQKRPLEEAIIVDEMPIHTLIKEPGKNIISSSQDHQSPSVVVPALNTSFVMASPPAIKKTDMPQPNVTDFDWYTEGGHVELCDTNGTFQLGAVLCSKYNTKIQLFNERQQFFEINTLLQPFKVIINGLMSIKTIPLGQAIEVYAPMIGRFRLGKVLKLAEVSKLTPIAFEKGVVEWLDLTSQTFKLVFHAMIPKGSVSINDTTPFVQLTSRQEENPVKTDSSSHENAVALASPTIPSNSSASPKPQPSNSSSSSSSPQRRLVYPILHPSQRIELYDDQQTKQFLKCKVVQTTNVQHEYQVQMLEGPATGETVFLHLLKHKCRIPLLASEWESYHGFLLGHRVDIYNKKEKNVQAGRVIGLEFNEKQIQVKLRDNSKQWIGLKNTKVKLRLNADASAITNSFVDSLEGGSLYRIDSLLPASEIDNIASNSHNTTEEYQKSVASPSPTKNQWNNLAFRPKLNSLASTAISPATVDQTISIAPQYVEEQEDEYIDEPGAELNRLSNVQLLDTSFDGNMESAARSPSFVRPLDFNRLHKFQSIIGEGVGTGLAAYSASFNTDDPIPAATAAVAESVASNNYLTPLTFQKDPTLPSIEDIWEEDIDPITLQLRYINPSTGSTQRQLPLWLRRHDPTSGSTFILNTSTNLVYPPEVHSYRDDNNATAPSSGSSSTVNSNEKRLTIPVGPLEAVRAMNR